VVDGFVGAVVLVDQVAGSGFAADAGRKLRLVRAHDDHRGGRLDLELLGVDVPAAGDAVDVTVIVRRAAPALFLLFTLGQTLLIVIIPIFEFVSMTEYIWWVFPSRIKLRIAGIPIMISSAATRPPPIFGKSCWLMTASKVLPSNTRI
jgi:hypothetical protein